MKFEGEPGCSWAREMSWVVASADDSKQFGTASLGAATLRTPMKLKSLSEALSSVMGAVPSKRTTGRPFKMPALYTTPPLPAAFRVAGLLPSHSVTGSPSLSERLSASKK